MKQKSESALENAMRVEVSDCSNGTMTKTAPESGVSHNAVWKGEADGRAAAASEADTVALEASAVADAGVPTRILIAPWGEVSTVQGSFLVDHESVQETIAAFARHGTDIPVDYEHQTLGGAYSSPSGQAPAAGWIKALSVVTPRQAAESKDGTDPGLYADVQWTDEAAQRLRARHYRYISPVALVRRRDRRIVALHSVALTNKPAIVGMRPVVGRQMLPALRLVPPIGGEPCADPQHCDRDALGTLRRALCLADSSPDDVVIIAAAERIVALEGQTRRRRAEDLAARAMAAGKLTPAQREWAVALAARDPAEFERWEEAAPVVAPIGRLAPSPNAGAATGVARRAAESAARAEYRIHRRFLEKLCTEKAYVACAVREADGAP